MLTKALKARYFPSSSVWVEKVGFNPSYAWRSIWRARPILELGVRWGIDDGKYVRLWKDAWAGKEGTGKIISPIKVLEENATVDTILDNANHCWKVDVIRILCSPLILSVF